MKVLSFNPVKSQENLSERVSYLLKGRRRKKKGDNSQQFSFGFHDTCHIDTRILAPNDDVVSFLDFLTESSPLGDIYLFGGILRDLAIYGKKGFDSDIDIVVDGSWEYLENYIFKLDSKRNKFGGYRLVIGGWDIDIWNAQDTWAFQKGIKKYNGVSSLLETTILNWDAILMNWRTEQILTPKKYINEVINRHIDIVLLENPNPLGTIVRVLRHLIAKDATSISDKTWAFIKDSIETFSYNEIKEAEKASYRENTIELVFYNYLKQKNDITNLNHKNSSGIISNIITPSFNFD